MNLHKIRMEKREVQERGEEEAYIVSREEACEESSEIREILERESHHSHPIERSPRGALRWKPNLMIREIALQRINLNDLWMLFYEMGLGKNDEPVRKLYRDLGYTLEGYWNLFYWEANNPEARSYSPPKRKKKQKQ